MGDGDEVFSCEETDGRRHSRPWRGGNRPLAFEARLASGLKIKRLPKDAAAGGRAHNYDSRRWPSFRSQDRLRSFRRRLWQRPCDDEVPFGASNEYDFAGPVTFIIFARRCGSRRRLL